MTRRRSRGRRKGGPTFTITLPRDKEPDVWQQPVKDVFRKVWSKD